MAERCGYGAALSRAHDGHQHDVARPPALDQTGELARIARRPAVDRDDDVVVKQAGCRRWAGALHTGHEGTAIAAAETLGFEGRDVADDHPQPGPIQRLAERFRCKERADRCQH
jgi:hypothetical protein